MFTGIIEELGELWGCLPSAEGTSLVIKCRDLLKDLKKGDSIAVNGVCLTATRVLPPLFHADVMPETLRKTSLHLLKNGEKINLERALPAGGRFGGHFVSGHVDGTGTLLAWKREGNALVIEFSAPEQVMPYVLDKGSIAVDGVSLTVVQAGNASFTVSLIPHTATLTTLGWKRPGATVNLEADLLGKYVERFIFRYLEEKGQSKAGSSFSFPEGKKGIDLNMLKEKGFM